MTIFPSNIYGSSWDSNWSLNAAMFKKSTMLLKKVNICKLLEAVEKHYPLINML